MSEPLVIIGNGMAAARLVEELSARSLGRYAVAVVGEEPRLAYNRVLLSAVLAREIASSEIELKSAAWWRARGVTLLYGHAAVGIDPNIRRVRLANGATLPYAKLVLATGSRPLRLSVPGMNLAGVLTFLDWTARVDGTPEPAQVPPWAIEAAAALWCGYLRPHAQAVLGANGHGAALDDARRVLRLSGGRHQDRTGHRSRSRGHNGDAAHHQPDILKRAPFHRRKR